MQERKDTEKEVDLPKNHPEQHYGLLWTFPKWLLVILFIVFVLALLVTVPQLHSTPKILLLFGFKALFAFLFLPILNCWTATLDFSRIMDFVLIIVAIIAVIVFALMMVMKVKWIKDLKNQNSIRTSKKEECEKENLRDLDAWEAYKQADNLYHQRFNFFLVAESMLVVSFATTFSSGCLNTNPVRIAITILGMIFTFSWFYVNNSIGYRMIYLREKGLRRCNPTYRSYLNVEEKLSIPSEFFMTDLLPAATFVFWCYLLYITVKLV